MLRTRVARTLTSPTTPVAILAQAVRLGPKWRKSVSSARCAQRDRGPLPRVAPLIVEVGFEAAVGAAQHPRHHHGPQVRAAGRAVSIIDRRRVRQLLPLTTGVEFARAVVCIATFPFRIFDSLSQLSEAL